MGKVNKKFIDLSQYKVPYNYELGGKSFHLLMDDGRELFLNFLDGVTLEWSEDDKPVRRDGYLCLKGDETTYLVHVRPREGGRYTWNWVLDLEQRLVTMDVMEQRYEEGFDRLIRNTPYFGAIDVPGFQLPAIRHHLSARMVGEHIYWRYNPGMAIQHIYHATNVVRASTGINLTPEEIEERRKARMEEINAIEDPEERAKELERMEAYKERQKYYPFYEEPCFHIWIKENLNLFCFNEEIMCRRSPNHEVGGGIFLLQDIERLIDVGVCFNVDQYYMLSAYGDPNDKGDPLDNEPSPYAKEWEGITSMPTVYWEQPTE